MASADRSIRLWRVADQTEVLRFQGHLEEVWALAFLPDGRTLISGDKEGSVRVWSLLSTNRSPSHERLPERASAFAFAPDGCLHLWHAPSFAEIETAERTREKPR